MTSEQTDGKVKENPYRYNAERVDYVPGIADFQYLRARYYRPDLARFITQDTVWGNINVPLTQNLYAYVGNNPINRIDPSGMSWLDDAWGWVVENKDAIIATAVTVATAVVITAAVVATAGAAAVAVGAVAGYAAASVGATAAISTAMTIGTAATYVAAGTIVAANATTVVGSVSQLATGSNVVVDGMTYAMGGTAEAWQKAYQINNGIGMYGMFAGSAFAQYGAQAQSAGYGSQKTAQAQQGSQRQGCDGGQGYTSFGKLKNAVGSPGEGKQWHHIVEQSQMKKSGFSAEQIQNTSNIIPVDKTTHAQISGYYNTKSFDFTGGLSVRDWLAGQSYETQYNFGVNVLKQFGVTQ